MNQQMQSAIAIEGAACGMSLEWDMRQDPLALWAALPDLTGDNLLVGLGAPLVAAVGARLDGLTEFEPLVQGRLTMPASQSALWTLLLGETPGAVFEGAELVMRHLSPVAHLTQATTLFSYRQGRDLTGYKDGSANPVGEDAEAAALIGEGEWTKGSFALVQRYVHFRDRLWSEPESHRDHIIGRRLQTDEEMDDAHPTAHIKRTEQEDFDPPAFMLRRSMPWGDAKRHGIQFIALMNDLDKARRMLRRMMGATDGIQDALLTHTQAETGAYYFFLPPVIGGRLKLPATGIATQPPPPPDPTAMVSGGPDSGDIIQLRQDGPLALRGDFRIGGRDLTSATLCRCGQSRNQPYCDGSHQGAGFTASGSRSSVAAPSAIAHRRPVVIQPIADGPLAVHGAVALIGEDGGLISDGAHPTLCRCGHSANKPFCDGSHARVAFKATD